MVIVHHLNESRSQRILWLLEELGVEYRIERYQRDPNTMLAPASLKAVHPLGKSPVITDGEITLAESGAIVEYLMERYGQGKLPVPAPGSPERTSYLYWMHYAEGSLMPMLVIKLIFEGIANGPVPFFIRPILKGISSKIDSTLVAPQLRMHFDFLEQTLQGREWFVGEQFTAADLQMAFPLEVAQARAGLDTRWPNLLRFLQQVQGRAAYQRALEAGADV